MTKETMIECMEHLEEGMNRTVWERKDWRDNLLWYICFILYELLKEKVRTK